MTKEGEVIKKRGPESKYSPEFCDKIIEIGEQGGGVAAMCKACGIGSFETFYRWLKEYPEFGKAYETAQVGSLAFYDDVLLAGALGRIKNYNFNSMAMILNNKFPTFYKRTSAGSPTTEINIGSINSIDQLSNDELDEKIKKLQQKLNLIPIIQKEEENNSE